MRTILRSINGIQSSVGETLRHGKGGQKFDWQREVRGFLYRFAQVDRRPGRFPIRDQIGARSHVWGVRSGHEGVEWNRSRAHGEGKAEYTQILFPFLEIIQYRARMK